MNLLVQITIILFLMHKWLCIKVRICYYKSCDHNFINIWISIFRLMKNRRKNCTSSRYEFNVPSNVFSLVKIFYRIQFSPQFIKQTIIWNAGDWNFQTEHTDTAFHHFYSSMTRPGIEPRSSGPLVNTLLKWIKFWYWIILKELVCH